MIVTINRDQNVIELREQGVLVGLIIKDDLLGLTIKDLDIENISVRRLEAIIDVAKIRFGIIRDPGKLYAPGWQRRYC